MMCDSAEELREAAQWSGKGIKSRQDLMEKLQGMSYIYLLYKYMHSGNTTQH